MALSVKFLYSSTPTRFMGINRDLKFLSNFTKIKTNFQHRKGETMKKSIWEQLLPSTILPNRIKTAADWSDIRNKLLHSEQDITPVSVDSIILNYCINMGNYSSAYSYLEFLKSTKVKLNLSTLGKYFKVFYFLNCGKVVNPEDEEDIYNRYKEIRETYNVLDSLTSENLILGLSLTKYWQECIKLLDEIKISSTPMSGTYSPLISAAFKNKDYNLGWNLLEEMIDKGRTPFDSVYLSYIEDWNTLDTKGGLMRNLEMLFNFFKLNNVECSLEVALKLIDTCKKLNISIVATNATNRGSCHNCQQKLQNLTLNEQDFQKLKQAIFEKVIVGKNVFYKTTPAELEKFTNFVTNMKKYDVVIDGLNVAYSAGTKHSSHILSRFIVAVVRHFVDQNKKVLVLGRTHMERWPNWRQVTGSADTFLTQSLSQDDPYLLYCALNSGLNTIIVSKDLMRSHLFRLKEPHLKIMFRHWLNQRQYQVRYIDNQGKVFLKHPPPFLRTAQSHNNGWHVPYIDNDESKWLCICT